VGELVNAGEGKVRSIVDSFPWLSPGSPLVFSRLQLAIGSHYLGPVASDLPVGTRIFLHDPTSIFYLSI